MKWEIDPDHSSVEFAVRHLMINRIKGQFERFRASFRFDPEDPTSLAVQASIDAGSLSTRQPQRDEHLKSEEFLDAARYPDIAFESAGCTPIGEREYELAGHLTLRGVTKPIVFRTSFEGLGRDPRGRERAGFHASARIDRAAFGLVFNSHLEAGGLVVANEVTIELNLEALRTA